MKLQRIAYQELNSRQQEQYNFHKVAAVLADFGFVSIKLSDDWNGADFIALHINGETLRVQLKGRLTFGKRYVGKDIWICFRSDDKWYLYPHDELLAKIVLGQRIEQTESWRSKHGYDFPRLSAALKRELEPYLVN